MFVSFSVLTYKWGTMATLEITDETIYVKRYLSHKAYVNAIPWAAGMVRLKPGEWSGKVMEILK